MRDTLQNLIQKADKLVRARDAVNASLDGTWFHTRTINEDGTETIESEYDDRYLEVMGWADNPEDYPGWAAHIFPSDMDRALKIAGKHFETKGDYPYQIYVRYYHQDHTEESPNVIYLQCRGQVLSWHEDGSWKTWVGGHVILIDWTQPDVGIPQEELPQERQNTLDENKIK